MLNKLRNWSLRKVLGIPALMPRVEVIHTNIQVEELAFVYAVSVFEEKHIPKEIIYSGIKRGLLDGMFPYVKIVKRQTMNEILYTGSIMVAKPNSR